MNVILIPGGTSNGTSTCLTHTHLFIILTVGFILLPAVLAWVGIGIHDHLARGRDEGILVKGYAQELHGQRTRVEAARLEATTHLNALARRLGQLQAQVLRLNALGERLTHMAGLDKREFNFDREVAVGGPEGTKGNANPLHLATLERLAREIESSRARRYALETLLLDRRLQQATTPLGWPTEGGFISSGFGNRADPFTGASAFHDGVDIAGRLNSPIRALGDGVVSYTGEKANFGHLIEITHDASLVTRYAHTSQILVKVGDKVTRGQTIDILGSSGRSPGPHFHHEIVRNGRAVNPGGYLRSIQ